MQNTKKQVAARWGVHPLEINSIMTNYPNDFKDVTNDHEKGDLFTDEQMERFGCFIKNETGTSWRSKLMKLLGVFLLLIMITGCGRTYSEGETKLKEMLWNNYKIVPYELEIKKFPESNIQTFSDTSSKRLLICKIKVPNPHAPDYDMPLAIGYYNGIWYPLNSYARTFFKGNSNFEMDVMLDPIDVTPINIEDWVFDRSSDVPVVKIVKRDERN
jgi:hypothetical protein